jgi:hypothetical protein
MAYYHLNNASGQFSKGCDLNWLSKDSGIGFQRIWHLILTDDGLYQDGFSVVLITVSIFIDNSKIGINITR